MIDKQKQRVNNKCNSDCINSLRDNDAVQIIQEIEVTPEKKCQEINDDPINKITPRNQK